MRLTSAGAIALALLLAPSLALSRPGLTRFEYTEPHMGTTFRVVLHAPDQASADAASRRAFARIAELDTTLTDYDATSELSRLTREAIGHPVPVSDDLVGVLIPSQELARRSDGAFDITVGPLTRLWRRARRQVELPGPDVLAEAQRATGYQLLKVDAAAQTVVNAAQSKASCPRRSMER